MKPEDQNVDIQVEDESSEKEYFTVIPNIIYRMGLGAYAIAYYSILKSISGEKGRCYMSQEKIAEMVGCSPRQIALLNKFLSQPFEILGGKSLIRIKPQKKNDGTRMTHLISIVNIWNENHTVLASKTTVPQTPMPKPSTERDKKNKEQNPHARRADGDIQLHDVQMVPLEDPSARRADKEEQVYIEEEQIYSSKEGILPPKEGTFVPSQFATSLLSEFYSSLFLAIPDFPKDSARKTKTQYQAADRIFKKANGDVELIRNVIAFAHEQGGFWLAHVHSVAYLDSKFTNLVQQYRSKGQKLPKNINPQPKYNFDTSPSNPRNSISFADHV